ncbi:16S rRNA [Trichonephila clavata]|uniref:16S rRNA n=1 Tax=Trichonephila clavata TaxID=2740835 RepID=A0A8X6I9C2_TRICU|nr:16S rRNA [Trichonephila clavata]
MVDSDYYNLQLPKKTAEDFGIMDNVTLICCSANGLPKPISKCDIVFIDPPYNSNLVESTLNGLAHSGWLSDNALIILEIRKNEDFNMCPISDVVVDLPFVPVMPITFWFVVLASRNSSMSDFILQSNLLASFTIQCGSVGTPGLKPMH